MNKTRSSKLTLKIQHPMRVLFKMRHNHKGVMRTIEDKSDDSGSFNLSNVTNADDSSVSFVEKRYEPKNRMRTEYSDRFGAFGIGNRSFIGIKNMRDTQALVTQGDEPQQNGVQDNDKEAIRKDTARFNHISLEKDNIDTRKRQEKRIEINPQVITFESIEEKIENLMNKRLESCMQFKKNSDWVIDSELSKLVDAYKEIKSSSNADNEEDVQYMQRKINMLEKLIAQNMVESEIAKKYYLSKVANSHWKHAKTQSFTVIQPMKQLKNSQIRHQSLVNTSNNQQSYHKPERSAYNLERKGNYSYNPQLHMQPLPRSSYNRDFLVYGAIRNLSSCKPMENDSLKPATSAKLMNSSYKLNFGPKKAEKINTKELDACRDKIKNLPIIFGKKEKEAIAYNLATYFKEKKKEGTSHSLDRIEPKPITNHFITESRKQFIQAVQISPSQIKHKNLQKLKYSYKKQLHM